MKEFNIRCGTPNDAEGIFEVMAKAFHVEENSSRWHSWKSLATNQATQFRVLEIDGRIISVALISPQRLRVGKNCEIIKGDVGEVSTLPEFQGTGYGSALMRDVVEWMRKNNYDMSRLGGYAGFYSRFGYVPFPRRFVEFSLESVKAGASNISIEEMYRPPEGLPGIVRSYDADRDSIRRDELYQIFNGERSGAIVSDFKPKSVEAKRQKVKVALIPSLSDPFRLVYEVDGIVEGYLFATDYGRDVTPFEAHITIGDIAFNPEYPDALEGLLKQILHFACEHGIGRVTARLPFDNAVLSILTQAKITFKLEELQGAYATNMIQIINIESLFRKICPELTARLRASALDYKEVFYVEIGFENQRVGLCVSDMGVNISSVDNANIQLLTDQATLMKLIFGIISYEEAVIANREKLDAFGSAVLSAWFPRQPCASGPWG
ncbi:GNAT family N-acetyltransferase [Candidatus Poribacteria bacterium]|nr:GNAT family N-acetyltransferase [Candidatus Poribacteria bacterium]